MGICSKVNDVLGRVTKKPNGGSGVSSPSATPATGPISPSPSAPSHDVDPWSRAYEIVQEREPELMVDYKKHLASLQGDTAASAADLSSQGSVEPIVKRLLENREQKQWRVALLGKDIKIREQVERLAKFLLWSDPVVKNAFSAQPYAALAWSGVSLLLPLLTSGTTQNEAMLRGFNSTSDVQVYWGIFEKTHLRSSHRQHYQDLLEPLAKLYSHVIEYQARVICHLSSAQLSRAWQNVAGYDWAGKAGEINELSTLCSGLISHEKEAEIRERWNGQLQEMQQSRAILDEICRILEDGGRQTQRIYENQQEKELLHNLASDYEGYKNINPQRVAGTCEWFFNDDRFRKWRDSSASSLLWVSAGPGCGKSVLSRALIDERRLSTNLTTSTVCHFFFKDGDERRMYSTSALCAILHQLFTQDPTGNLIGHALPSHKNYGKNLAQNFSELWRILVECARSSDIGEIVCIFDAFDECEKKSRDGLINKLKDFYCQPPHPPHSSSKLKFLITSRPYDDLETYFENFLTTNYLRFDGDDKSADTGREINLVIDVRVNEIARNFTADDRHKISARLKTLENRTYLWLYLIFDTIEENLSGYGKRSSIEKLLCDIPSKVSEAYEKILSKSQNEVQTDRLLRIILAAVQPLTLDEANFALTLALQEERFTSHAALQSDLWPSNFGSIVKNLCGLFINVYDSKLSFIHQTAREFLTNPQRQGKWEGRLNMPMSHSTMSLVCLHYLLLPDLATPVQNSSQRPFLPYAAKHWPLHYISQEEIVADQSRKDARMLCNVAGKQASVWAPNYFPMFYRWEQWNDLALASYLGLKLVVGDVLAEEKIDVNAQGGFYGTALHAASVKGHKEVVEILLDKGAGINTQDGSYGTALQAASVRGRKEVVEMLLDKGADINAQGGFYGTALQAASAKDHQEVVKILLDKGADINTQDGYFGTALQAASAEGYKEVVKILLDKGADINAQGGFYGTALQAASEKAIKKSLKYFLIRALSVLKLPADQTPSRQIKHLIKPFSKHPYYLGSE
ncbi:hypothetical protein DL771_007496 [Monosporascus sp. 5C6A]|nr:hypothetical protein DL771_007496 [Monosporascus sp. 5C6A]